MVQSDATLGGQSTVCTGKRIEYTDGFRARRTDFLLGCDEAVAGKDRLDRALDKALEHRDALMGHLQERWSDLFWGRMSDPALRFNKHLFLKGKLPGCNPPRAATP